MQKFEVSENKQMDRADWITSHASYGTMYVSQIVSFTCLYDMEV